LHPTKLCSSAQDIKDIDDNVTIVASNMSNGSTHSYKARALTHILNQSEFSGATFCLNIKDAIADSGARQIFVKEGTTVINKPKTKNDTTPQGYACQWEAGYVHTYV
jgi:hypothetical protein